MVWKKDAAHIHNVIRREGIARRYIIVNGFDGALTVLALCVGFALNRQTDLDVALTAGVSASVALAVSGVNSAWLSESAERKRQLGALELAMLRDLKDSRHERTRVWLVLAVAASNGLSPLLLGLLILLPAGLHHWGFLHFQQPMLVSIFTGACLLFVLGALTGRISGQLWFSSGLRALIIAGVTAVLIYLLS